MMKEKGAEKTVSFYTLGCKLNFAETSTIARQFEEKGYQKVDFKEKADVVVINTCSVTQNADKKCRQAISKIYNTNPNAYITMVGCYSQLEPKKISEIKGVDLVIGTQDKFKVADLVEKYEKNGEAQIHACAINQVNEFSPSYSFGDRTRSFLKVQDGCDYYCSFCTIPYARGKSRNSKINDVVVQAKGVAHKGAKEIVLTGVNIGDFGKTTGESFFDLLKELAKINEIKRYRISSIEPNLLTNEIIDFCAQEDNNFMPHFHIPLQSGSNKILSLMKRKYRRELYADRVQYIKQRVPNAFIGCDVIVGFPGESENDFLDTYNFIENLDISAIHVFTYSDREKALANKITSKVDPKEKNRRSDALHNLSVIKTGKFYSSHLNSNRKALMEKQQNGEVMYGFTDNYIKIEAPYNADLAGEIIETKLESISESGNVTAKII
jgi:threonylcarbamoyladenosine tRNA methylthiotransferase MtaB